MVIYHHLRQTSRLKYFPRRRCELVGSMFRIHPLKNCMRLVRDCDKLGRSSHRDWVRLTNLRCSDTCSRRSEQRQRQPTRERKRGRNTFEPNVMLTNSVENSPWSNRVSSRYKFQQLKIRSLQQRIEWQKSIWHPVQC